MGLAPDAGLLVAAEGRVRRVGVEAVGSTRGRPGSPCRRERLRSVTRPDTGAETVEGVVGDLVDKGFIVRRRGIGTRVVQPKVRRPLELTSLYDDLAESGQSPTTAVIELSHAEADEIVAGQLDVPSGTEVLRVVRLRSAAGNPNAKLTNYLPLSRE